MLNSRPSSGAFVFSFALDEKETFFKLLEWGVNLRSKVFDKPYGDQAFFMKSGTFYKVGGFSSIGIMEDFEMIRRLKKLGKIKILSSFAITSARRLKKLESLYQIEIITKII